jgi:hypothetical protein
MSLPQMMIDKHITKRQSILREIWGKWRTLAALSVQALLQNDLLLAVERRRPSSSPRLSSNRRRAASWPMERILPSTSSDAMFVLFSLSFPLLQVVW